MRITIDGKEVFSKKYETFNEMSEEYIDYETERGRRVPDYELNALLMAIAFFILDKAYDEFRGWSDRRRERKESQEQSELDEERHKELLNELDEVLRATKESKSASGSTSAEAHAEGKDRVLTLLKWARENNIDVSISMETGAEGDLEEVFEDLMEDESRGPVNEG